MRSKLFVPAARPDLLAKALASEADAISFDLEDAVPADGKDEARFRLASFLRSDEVRASAKTMIVRINAHNSEHFGADITALKGARVDMINLPKADEAEDVTSAAEAITGALPGIGLLVNIETPSGLVRAASLADAHPCVVGLQVGLNDLFDPLRINRASPANVHAVLWQVRMAAAEANIFAYDGAWPDLGDLEGFRQEAGAAASLGFLGKSCIHPSQIGIANALFDRSAELISARRILDAARDAAADGRGAFLLDGKMIDQPAIAHAAAILAAAENA